MQSHKNLSLDLVPTWKVVSAIGIGALATTLFAFMRSATGDFSSGDPSIDAGQQVGTVIGAALLPWLAGYFLAFRKAAKSTKWVAAAVLLVAGGVGFMFGQSIAI